MPKVILRRHRPFQMMAKFRNSLKAVEGICPTVNNVFGELNSYDRLSYISLYYSYILSQITASSFNRSIYNMTFGVGPYLQANPKDSYDLQVASTEKYKYSISSPNYYHTPDINPEYTKVPVYNVPMRPPMTSQDNLSPSIVTASFGMQYLVNLQQKSLDKGIPLSTYTYTEITKKSFEDILEFAKSKSLTVFTHYGEKLQKHYEILMEDGFISIEHTHKVPADYFINNAIMPTSVAEEIHPLIELKPKTVEVQWVDRITQSGDLNIKTIPIPRNKTFVEEAYPFLNDISLQDFINGYLESDAAVLLLYGAPGTGKTSLLKQILHYANESCLITYNKDIANMDSLFSHFYDSDERFLIIEDADTYINSRQKDGNEVMKKLLNITDGLTAKKEKKVIFTSNLNNLADVDEALLREGRCYEAIPVGALEKEQAVKVLSRFERLDLEESLPDQITLANLFALLAGRREDQSTELVNSGFGFGVKKPK